MRMLSLLLVLLLATCGGGSGPATDDGGGGTFPVPHDPPTNPGTPPGGEPSAPTLPPGLTGGVFATFAVGPESFALWTIEPTLAQALVDAWDGVAPAITHICADVEPGSGTAGHNAPWSWSVREVPGPIFHEICFGCAFAWDTPSKAEAGIRAGPPYNCDGGPAGGPRAMIRMQVALTGLVDAR